MKIKEIELNYGVTRNLGNFESLRIDIAVRAEIEEADQASLEQVVEGIRRGAANLAHEHADAEVKRITGKRAAENF